MDFATYLQELADPAEALAISKLANLSSLGPDEATFFSGTWMELDLVRRQRVVDELIDLAEDNIELNFDAIYLVALADRDAAIRRRAVQGLCEYEGRDLIDALVGLLESDADASVRAESALALGRFVLHAAFDKLNPGDASRIDDLLRRVARDESEVTEVRGRALEAIGVRDEPWVRDLIEEAFDDGDRRLRLSAVHAMGRSCDPAWLPALLPELESDDAELRFEAAVALGSIADEAATPHLLPLLRDEDEQVQDAVIGALGEIGGPQAREVLEELATAAGERVREAAVAALAEVDFAEDPLGFKARG
ncbi:MAG: HEAT repeat domain-containing protein [Dehalococcoidia bacterium]